MAGRASLTPSSSSFMVTFCTNDMPRLEANKLVAKLLETCPPHQASGVIDVTGVDPAQSRSLENIGSQRDFEVEVKFTLALTLDQMRKIGMAVQQWTRDGITTHSDFRESD